MITLIILIILHLIILIIFIRWMDERKEQEEVEALREEVFIALLRLFLIRYLSPCFKRQKEINVHVQARKAALAKSREQERKDLNR